MSRIAFVDGRLPNLDQLLDTLDRDVEVCVLTSDRDGIQQVADVLQTRSGVDSIYIFSHGSSGRLYIGASDLSVSNISEYTSQFRTIGSSMPDSGDILLFGCNVAQGADGALLIEQLASLTGADIAASTDASGDGSIGGNWLLEASVGSVESTSPFASRTPEYGAVLSTSYALVPSASTINEGKQLTFAIARAGDTPAETVYFSTRSDGTATYAAGDYSTTSGGAPANIPVTFSTGGTSKTVTLDILRDAISDPGEQFRAIVQRSNLEPASSYMAISQFVTINEYTNSKSFTILPDEYTTDPQHDKILHVVGSSAIRLNLISSPRGVLSGIDLNNNGTFGDIAGELTNLPMVSGYEIIDAYRRDFLDTNNATRNFTGDITTAAFLGGPGLIGLILLGGVGVDRLYGSFGDDFLAGGCVNPSRFVESVSDFTTRDTRTGIVTPLGAMVTGDQLVGGNGDDYFFAEFSGARASQSIYSDPTAWFDDSSQDEGNDWILLEATEREGTVRVWLGDLSPGGLEAPPVRPNLGSWGGQIVSLSGEWMGLSGGTIDNLDASGDFHGKLDGVPVALGERGRLALPQTGSANNGVGSSAQLIVYGTEKANQLIGGRGNDSFYGFGGNDYINGGQGFDTAGYLGVRNLYTVTGSASKLTVAGPEGTDTLVGIEQIKFSDTTLDYSGNAPTLSISAVSASKAEGNSGTTPFTFSVSRGGDTSGATSASWKVSLGTVSAASAADFSGATSGTVNWAAGDASNKSITINVVGDQAYESCGLEEQFSVILTGAAGGVGIKTSAADGKVVNDDPVPDVLDIGTIEGSRYYGVFADLAKAAYQLGLEEVGRYAANETKPNVTAAWDRVMSEWTPVGPNCLGGLSGENEYVTYQGKNLTWYMEDNGIYYCENAAALVVRCGDALAISFRGTNDTSKADFSPTVINPDLDPSTPDIRDWLDPDHHYDLLRPLIDMVDSYVEKGAISSVLVTGHSLGGAMALIYMNAANHERGSGVDYDCVTFAAPNAFTSQVWKPDDRITLLEIDGDPVPNITDSQQAAPAREKAGYTVEIDPIGLPYVSPSQYYHSMDLYSAIASLVDANNVQFEFHEDDLGTAFFEYPKMLLSADIDEIDGDGGKLYSVGSSLQPLVSEESSFWVDGTIDRILVGGPDHDELVLKNIGAAYGGDGDDEFVVYRNSGQRYEISDSSGVDRLIIRDANGIFDIPLSSTEDIAARIDGNDLVLTIQPTIGGVITDHDEGVIRIHNQGTSQYQVESLQIRDADDKIVVDNVSLVSIWERLSRNLELPATPIAKAISTVTGSAIPDDIRLQVSDVQGPYGFLVLDGQDTPVYEPDIVYHPATADMFSVDLSAVRIKEGDSDPLIVTVRRSENVGQASSIDWRLRFDGADLNDLKLASAGGRLLFDPGEVAKAFGILPIDDSLREGTERFAVELFDPLDPIALIDLSWVSVTDNDPPRYIFGLGDEADGEIRSGTEFEEVFYMGQGPDAVSGMGGDDSIHGGAGDDRLDGGVGADSILGGDGDDLLIGGLGNDVLDGGPGFDTVDYSDSSAREVVDFSRGTSSGGGDDDRLANIEAVAGSRFGDALIGDGKDNSFRGNGGDDVLNGGGGADSAEYSGNRTNFTIKKTGVKFVATDKSGDQGADTLSAIEKLVFDDATFALVNPARTHPPDYGKDVGFLFDSVYYLLANPQKASTVTVDTALADYLSVGGEQHLAPNSWFDAAYYATKWADLAPLHLDDATLFMHYNLYGVWEGRSAGPKFDHFDGNRYLSDWPDVAAYVDANLSAFLGSRANGAIAHFIIYGAEEQRMAYDTSGTAVDMGYVL